MGYSAPRTWTAGEIPTAAQLNQDIRDNVSFLANPPRAQVRRTSTQSISNASWNLVTFTVEDVDTDLMFSTGTGDRFTAVTAGRYEVIFSAAFATNATGVRGWAVAKGTTGSAGFVASKLINTLASFETAENVVGEVVLAVGETCSVQVFQNSGGSLNLVADAATLPFRCKIRYVGPS